MERESDTQTQCLKCEACGSVAIAAKGLSDALLGWQVHRQFGIITLNTLIH